MKRVAVATVLAIGLAWSISGHAQCDTLNLNTLDGGTHNETSKCDIHVKGKIDGAANVTLRSDGGDVTIDNQIDGGSTVRIKGHNISIGQKIDGASKVYLCGDKDGTIDT